MCSPRAFHCAVEGFNEKEDNIILSIRHATNIIGACLVGGDKFKISQVWPLENDRERSVKPLTPEEQKAIKQRIKQLQSNGKRTRI